MRFFFENIFAYKLSFRPVFDAHTVSKFVDFMGTV